MVRIGVAAAAVSVVVSAWAAPAWAAPSSFDTTFSGDGKVVVDPSSGTDFPYSIAVQEDGKVLVAGRSAGAGGRMMVLRFTDTGVLDTTFSGDGKAFVDFGGQNDYANDVAVTDDDQIVLMGGAQNGSRVAVARLNADGTPDTTFSGDGKVSYDYVGGADYAADGTLLDDGSILMVGESDGATAVWKLTPAGDRDTGFGTNGRRVRNMAPTVDAGIDLAVDGEGNIVVVGSTDLGSENGNAAKTMVLRFTSTGTNDTSFSGDGSATLDLVPNRYEDATEVEIQEDGGIVVVGEAFQNLSLLRFTDAGGLDPTFSGDGKVRLNRPGPYEWLSGLDIQADGRILVAGSQVINNKYEPLIGRYNTNGTVDTTFASGSGFVTRSLSASDDYITDLTVLGDGRFVVVAMVQQAQKVGVMRFLGG